MIEELCHTIHTMQQEELSIATRKIVQRNKNNCDNAKQKEELSESWQ